MSKGKLIIERTNLFVNKIRDIHFYLDGEKLGSIANGETVFYDVEEGEHLLHAKIDWVKTKTVVINVKQNSDVKMELGSPYEVTATTKYLWLLRLLILGAGTFLDSYYKNYLFAEMAILILATWFVYELFLSKQKPILYYLTFGKDHFLYLKEKT